MQNVLGFRDFLHIYQFFYWYMRERNCNGIYPWAMEFNSIKSAYFGSPEHHFHLFNQFFYLLYCHFSGLSSGSWNVPAFAFPTPDEIGLMSHYAFAGKTPTMITEGIFSPPGERRWGVRLSPGIKLELVISISPGIHSSQGSGHTSWW